MKVSLVKHSKVKEFAKAEGVSIGAEALELLTKKLEELLKAAAERAKANKRKTIKSCDL
jgi:histone H3/H4